MYSQPGEQMLGVWCPCYIIHYLVMGIVDTSLIRDVEKMPRQVRPEGLASQSFSISPEQSLEEDNIRNGTSLE